MKWGEMKCREVKLNVAIDLACQFQQSVFFFLFEYAKKKVGDKNANLRVNKKGAVSAFLHHIKKSIFLGI